MTALEIILSVVLVVLVVLFIQQRRELATWKRYARNLKRRAESAEFLAGVLTVPAVVGGWLIFKRVQDAFRSRFKGMS